MSEVNIACIERFFQTLSSDEREIYTYFWMDEAKGIAFETQHGAVERILSEVSDNVAAGRTLHAVLNRTNMRGKSSGDVTSCRVLCVDLDRETPKEELLKLVEGLDPHLVVESSPGKYHLYWPLSPEVPLEAWKLYQAGLAQHLSGDRNLSQISHSIRVPGIPRITKKGEKFLPRVVFAAKERVELDVKEVLSKFPWIEEESAEAKKEGDKKRAEHRKVRKSGSYKKLGSKYGRNEALRDAVFFKAMEEGISQEEAMTFGELVCQDFDKSDFSDQEIHRTTMKAWKAGLAVHTENKKIFVDTLVTKGASPNGEIKSFDYDYDADKELKLNRFTDLAVISRVRQRFGSLVIKTGQLLYAFDEQHKVWRKQKKNTETEILSSFVDEASDDVVHDECFEARFGTAKESEGRASQILAAQDKFKNVTKQAHLVMALFSNHKWRRESIDIFDADKYKLLVKNGVLDLKQPEKGVRDATHEDLLLRRADVEFKEGATYTEWEEFLLQVFKLSPDRPAIIRFLQEIFGYSLTGEVDEQSLYLHTGGGSNGKSTVLGVLKKLMGEYVCFLNCNALGKTKTSVGGELNRLGAKIEGKRIVILDDLNTESQWNESIAKNLTSETIISKRLYEEEIDIPNQAKFHIGCNAIPEAKDASDGLLRRICIVPYSNKFEPDASESKRIAQMINRELSGILNWSLKGLARVLAQGGKVIKPEEVLEAHQEYKEENFQTDVWLERFFEQVDPEKSQEIELIGLDRLVRKVNDELSAASLPTVNKVKLGRFLTEKLKYERLRKGTSKSKITIYKVVFSKTENEQFAGLAPN